MNINYLKDKKVILKLKPIQFEEFKPIIEWWNNRTENEFHGK
jgi:type I restriction enzyme M protein